MIAVAEPGDQSSLLIANENQMRIDLTRSGNMPLDCAVDLRLHEPHPNNTGKVSLRVLDRLLHTHLHTPLQFRQLFVDLGPMQVRRDDLPVIPVTHRRLEREVDRGVYGWNNRSGRRGAYRTVLSEGDRLGNKLSFAKPGLFADIIAGRGAKNLHLSSRSRIGQ